MHELSIANEILLIINKNLENYKAKKINKIVLNIGKFSGIVIDSLLFGLEVMTKGTLLEKTKIEVKEIPLKIFCKNCKKNFIKDEFLFICPDCGKNDIEIISGQELELSSIEFEE